MSSVVLNIREERLAVALKANYLTSMILPLPSANFSRRLNSFTKDSMRKTYALLPRCVSFFCLKSFNVNIKIKKYEENTICFNYDAVLHWC